MIGIEGTKHISRNNWGFQIEKKINGKYHYFGFGTTLIIALMKRDWCEANNWEKKYPVNYKYIFKRDNGKFQIVKRLNGKTETFGIFNTYEEAEKEVKKCKLVDWDLELLCEIDERTCGTEWLPKKLQKIGVF